MSPSQVKCCHKQCANQEYNYTTLHDHKRNVNGIPMCKRKKETIRQKDINRKLGAQRKILLRNMQSIEDWVKNQIWTKGDTSDDITQYNRLQLLPTECQDTTNTLAMECKGDQYTANEKNQRLRRDHCLYDCTHFCSKPNDFENFENRMVQNHGDTFNRQKSRISLNFSSKKRKRHKKKFNMKRDVIAKKENSTDSKYSRNKNKQETTKKEKIDTTKKNKKSKRSVSNITKASSTTDASRIKRKKKKEKGKKSSQSTPELTTSQEKQDAPVYKEPGVEEAKTVEEDHDETACISKRASFSSEDEKAMRDELQKLKEKVRSLESDLGISGGSELHSSQESYRELHRIRLERYMGRKEKRRVQTKKSKKKIGKKVHQPGISAPGICRRCDKVITKFSDITECSRCSKPIALLRGGLTPATDFKQKLAIPDKEEKQCMYFDEEEAKYDTNIFYHNPDIIYGGAVEKKLSESQSSCGDLGVAEYVGNDGITRRCLMSYDIHLFPLPESDDQAEEEIELKSRYRTCSFCNQFMAPIRPQTIRGTYGLFETFTDLGYLTPLCNCAFHKGWIDVKFSDENIQLKEEPVVEKEEKIAGDLEEADILKMQAKMKGSKYRRDLVHCGRPTDQRIPREMRFRPHPTSSNEAHVHSEERDKKRKAFKRAKKTKSVLKTEQGGESSSSKSKSDKKLSRSKEAHKKHKTFSTSALKKAFHGKSKQSDETSSSKSGTDKTHGHSPQGQKKHRTSRISTEKKALLGKSKVRKSQATSAKHKTKTVKSDNTAAGQQGLKGNLKTESKVERSETGTSRSRASRVSFQSPLSTSSQ